MNHEQPFTSIQLTPARLKALAHPLRVLILGILRSDGPATSSGLARMLNTTSGATSYHLRQLERHEFVAEVPEMGTARERYWKACHDYTNVERSQIREDAEALAAFDEFTRIGSRIREIEVLEWIDAMDDWGDAWTEASGGDDYLLRLTHGELAELIRDIRSLVTLRAARPRDDVPDDAEIVRMHLLAFPVVDPVSALVEGLGENQP